MTTAPFNTRLATFCLSLRSFLFILLLLEFYLISSFKTLTTISFLCFYNVSLRFNQAFTSKSFSIFALS